MNYIKFVFLVMVMLIIYIILMRIWMEISNFIGERFRVFVAWLLRKE